MIKEDKGLFYKDIAIDSLRKSSLQVLTTHAHSDHYMSSNTLFSSQETAELISKSYNPTEKIKSVKVQEFDSGHILGSKQFLLDDSILVTGDIKLKPSLTTPLLQPAKADTLIIESTFGLPQHQFPDKEQIYKEISSFITENKDKKIIFGAYSLGKAQELIKILNEYANITPSVHEKIFTNSEIYNSYNAKLSFNLFSENSDVYILPHSLLNRNILFVLRNKFHQKIKTATVSGWGQQYPAEKNFLLSDHCDFNDLLSYIKQVEPKIVYTYHGFSYEFARYIRSRLNIPALPISRKQEVLLSYV